MPSLRPTESSDCVVIGGGPAGSTFASIVRKYAPQARVLVLEKARFPRWHIGESTIPVANGVLRDLEVYEELKNSTHIKKIGAVFVWGQDRKPWNAEYLALEGLDTADSADNVIDVTGQDMGSLIGNLKQPDTPFLSFNVRRAEFDHLLLNRSRDFGADVREGTRVTRVGRDSSGRVTRVDWKDDQGRTGSIETPFVLDASGLSAIMAGRDRIHDPHMNNYAVYGYLSGADWKVTYNGKRELTTLFVAAVEKGWIWYFPVDDDVMSVGVVTNTEHFKDRLKKVNLEKFFWEILHSCPELSTVTRNARLRSDVLPAGKKVAASRDWAYRSARTIGEGWASAGDAAVFIDPVLASGLTMAMLSGHRAAYTFNTARARPDLDPAGLWRAYSDYVRAEAACFVRLSRYFYANNRAVESWWWEAQRLVNRSGQVDVTNRQAFAMATAGFFPVPRAISPEVMLPVMKNLFGEDVADGAVERERKTESADLTQCAMKVLTPFRLDVQTEPALKAAKGELDVFYDLVTDDEEYAHRLAASPCSIAPSMEPVIKAMGRHTSVAALIEEAPSLLPPDFASPEAVRKSTLSIVRMAALKGLVELRNGDE